jgi:IS1 family transposase/transposase-like protein
MIINIILNCPHCHSRTIVKNGKKHNGTQNYHCKDCSKQFISDHERTYRGSLSWITALIKIMLVRGCGIRDISIILSVSVKKVLKTLTSSCYQIKPKKKHYDKLEIDEFWTYVHSKTNKIWLIYAYCRESGEIVAYVWGKRDIETASRLRKRLQQLGVKYNRIGSDKWDSFLLSFGDDVLLTGKRYTVGIEGNNCRLRHRVKRASRKTCCFSKRLLNHMKSFSMAFFYINYGFV